MPMPGNISKNLWNVFCGMKDDEFTIIAKNDPLIVKLGSYYEQRAGHKKNAHHYISQKMREAARLVQEAHREDLSIASARDLINPKNFDVVVDAARSCSSFDEKSGFGTPSLDRKLGHILNRLSEIFEEDDRPLEEGGNQGFCIYFLGVLIFRFFEDEG